MLKTMGLCVGILMVGGAIGACSSDDSGGTPGNDGAGGTTPGAGGTVPTAQGGTGGTPAQGGSGGTGGTPAQGGSGGSGGTTPVGQGGSAGMGAGGAPGPGGSGGAGAGGEGGFAGAPLECDECQPCDIDDYVHTSCDPCLCEHAENPYHDTYQELMACELDEPCLKSSLYRDPGSISWENGECLLTALRDRTPGRYEFSSTFADLGSQTRNYVFLVGDDDQVTVFGYGDTETSNITRSYWPVQTCTLKSYEDLDGCVDAGTNVSPTTTAGPEAEAVCDTVEDWMEDCQDVAEPACPSE